MVVGSGQLVVDSEEFSISKKLLTNHCTLIIKKSNSEFFMGENFNG